MVVHWHSKISGRWNLHTNFALHGARTIAKTTPSRSNFLLLKDLMLNQPTCSIPYLLQYARPLGSLYTTSETMEKSRPEAVAIFTLGWALIIALGNKKCVNLVTTWRQLRLISGMSWHPSSIQNRPWAFYISSPAKFAFPSPRTPRTRFPLKKKKLIRKLFSRKTSPGSPGALVAHK